MSKVRSRKKYSIGDNFYLSMIISLAISIIFLSLGILIWAKYPPFPDFMQAVNNVHELLGMTIESILIVGFYFFMVVFVAILREYLGEVAGWTEIITVYVVALIIAYALFGPEVTAISGIVNVFLIFYFYYLQEES